MKIRIFPNSIVSVTRMTGASKVTILRLLADAGTPAAQSRDQTVRGLESRRVQSDTVWPFCGAKDKALAQGAAGFGSVWTWIAIDSESKPCVCYLVGLRDGGYATGFVRDAAGRIDNRVAPDLPARWAFTETEAQLLEHLVPMKDGSRKRTVGHFLTRLAKLDGDLDRTPDPPPGNMVLWRGMTRLTDIHPGFSLAKDGGN